MLQQLSKIIFLLCYFSATIIHAEIKTKAPEKAPTKIEVSPATAPTTAPEATQPSANIPATNPPKKVEAENKQEEIIVQPDMVQIRNFEKIELPQEIQKSRNLKHEVIRRIAIFPFFTNGLYKKQADLAWWKAREFLSEQQRFLVATKRFLEQKDVYQPRKSLRITDAVLLSQILDSDCLITGFLDNGKFTMEAYSNQDGQLLWTKTINLISSKPLSEQIEDASLKLIQDFLANIPYQGFQIVDPLNEKPYIEEGNNIIARIDVGAKAAIKKGQKVQWVEVERNNAYPLFQGGSIIRIIAEGEVVVFENQVATVNIKRSKDLTILNKKAIVHFPDEFSRLTAVYGIKDVIKGEVSTAYLSAPMIDTEERFKESRPLLTALASIANVVLFLLIAL